VCNPSPLFLLLLFLLLLLHRRAEAGLLLQVRGGSLRLAGHHISDQCPQLFGGAFERPTQSRLAVQQRPPHLLLVVLVGRAGELKPRALHEPPRGVAVGVLLHEQHQLAALRQPVEQHLRVVGLLRRGGHAVFQIDRQFGQLGLPLQVVFGDEHGGRVVGVHGVHFGDEDGRQLVDDVLQLDRVVQDGRRGGDGEQHDQTGEQAARHAITSAGATHYRRASGGHGSELGERPA
jgi:hypothetical protein